MSNSLANFLCHLVVSLVLASGILFVIGSCTGVLQW